MHFQSKYKVNLFTIVMFVILSGCIISFPVSRIKATDGTLDLQQIDFTQTPIIELNGDWEFYWDTLISPSEFLSGTPGTGITVPVPGNWKSYKGLKGEKSPDDFGYGTYALKLTGLSHHSQDLLFHSREFRSAGNVYWVPLGEEETKVNISTPIISTGIVSTNPKESVPLFRHQYAPMKVCSVDSAFIVVHVSNFTIVSGGIRSSLELGTQTAILRSAQNKRSLFFLIYGIFLIIAFHHFTLYLKIREDKSSFYIALFTFSYSFLATCNLWHLYELIETPGLVPFLIIIKVSYIAIAVSLSSVFSYFTHAFGITKDHRGSHLLWYITGTFSLLTLFPLPIVEFVFKTFYFPVIIIVTFYAVLIVIRSVQRGKKGAKLALFASLVVFITSFIDVLSAHDLINTPWIAPYGLLAFTLIQTYILSSRFTNNYQQAQYLSRNLEKEVTRKTLELKQQAEDLERVNSRLIASENGKRILTTTIVHDIKNYVFGVSLNIRRLTRKSKGEYRSHLNKVTETCQNIYDLAINMLDISHIESHDITLKKVAVGSEKLLKLINNNIYLDTLNEKNISLECTGFDELTFIYIDKTYLERVIHNLINNAYKYTPQDGTISITLEPTGEGTLLSFFNTGNPIPKEYASSVFDRYTTLGKNQYSDSKGIGLFFCKMVMDKHGGKIWLESSETGNFFNLLFPYQAE